MSVSNLEGILSKVKGLLAVAEDQAESNPAMAANYRAKAEKLMRQYRIEEESLIAGDQFSITPVLRKFKVCSNQYEFEDWIWTLFSQVMTHVDSMHIGRYESDSGQLYLIGQAVGYESDLRYADLLWQSIRLSFISRITPEYDPDLSDAENIYNLRSAGIPRKDIAEKIWGKWTHANSAKVAKIYKAECERRGEQPAMDGRGIHNKTFREVYAREFVYRVWDRLVAARDAVMAQGGAIDLGGRADRVKEAFYNKFPDQRPNPAREAAMTVTLVEEPKKGRKRLAETETKAYQEKMRRMYESPAARAGARAGKEAGDTVNISRTAPRTDRVEGSSGVIGELD